MLAASERFACQVARLLADDKCDDVHVLDLRDLSPLVDFVVLATGTSDRQLKSSADDLHELARQQGRKVYGSEGEPGSRWRVEDFVDVVVHLFDADTRAYYDLESLWSDARKVDWSSKTRPGQFADLWSMGRRQRLTGC